MAKESRIKFNPVTGEVEVEGTETFVKNYFDKLQQLLSGDGGKISTGRGRKKSASTKLVAKKMPKTSAKEVAKPRAKKATKTKKTSAIDKVVQLIQDSDAGLSMKNLKEKTKLNSRQVSAAIYRALKLGKIQRAMRGLYMKA